MWLDKLREMKNKSGLKTKEIAVQSGIPEPTLEKLFAGVTKDPKLETIRQLVHFLGYTLDDLEDEPKRNPPSVAETTPGEKIDRLVVALNDMLVSQGFIQNGRDLTDRQSEVLLAVCRIIDATFKD